jgi:uncharacterized phage-associated protein
MLKGEPPRTAPPYKAKAIANFFLDCAKRDGEALTQMKLQKLVYFAHGWHLALVGTPLIDERVQAWDFGPVVRTLYDEFKRYGRDPVTEHAISIDDEMRFYQPIVAESDKETRLLLNRVWKVYKRLSAYQMSNLTHRDGTPWKQIYSANLGIRNVVIDDENIKQHFLQLADANRRKAAG